MGLSNLVLRLKKISGLSKSVVAEVDDSLVARLVGCLPPALIPPIHIATLYYFWHQFSRRVDKRYCSCSCWDTVFKGTYESGIASYKHIYFNASINTFKIWMLTVVFVILFYESMRRLILLSLQSHLRYSMLLLFLSAIFSHYYSWWAYVNYWNDDYYAQWNHQMFFTSTEFVSSIFVLQLADRRMVVTSRKAFAIVGIAILHVVAGSLDQFIINVIKGEGHLHQVLRDMCFMIPDLLHVFIPLLELKRFRSLDCSHIPLSDLKRDFMIITTLIFGGLFLCSFL